MVIVEQLMEWRWAGEPKYSEKARPRPTLSTIDTTRLDPSANPGRRSEKQAATHLSYGTALRRVDWYDELWNGMEAVVS
jgi:hypothetical protein